MLGGMTMWKFNLAFALVLWTMLSGFAGVYAIFTLSGGGREKDAWPELLHSTLNDARAVLNGSAISGSIGVVVVANVHVQSPSAGAPPPFMGTLDDVWLYTDGNDIVYEIPKRGMWHPNRVAPGWPELAGKEHKAAMTQIKHDYLGVTVVYGPKGYFRIQDYRLDRVWLDVNPDGTVAAVPAIG